MSKKYLVLSAVILCALFGGLAQAHGNRGNDSPWGLHAQIAQGGEVRSRSEVVQEVKDRYNAKVLRIELSRDRSVYHVRVLMPNGKVRDLTVNARR